MKPTLVVGIDPGLVHTGVVQLLFVPEVKKISVWHEVVAGPNADAVGVWLLKHLPNSALPKRAFIEAYRPRANLNSDARMVAAVNDLKRVLPNATVLPNTGIKSVVKRDLMELLGVWKFKTPTHHDDLRSAARIMLLGMLKDDELNQLVTSVILSHIAGGDWIVEHRV